MSQEAKYLNTHKLYTTTVDTPINGKINTYLQLDGQRPQLCNQRM